eukprot:CAMPEP_0181417268 /NCGR_PEP_ID=MMETSP1110-20121109/10953_1 /TAXON_ID=174948 /ORGANISM="Symbiodinium sp., Strain CCMP421" /LENGTH=82 /DNA_ID=CAMNT_0023540213 /DNA_START=570 /DNA_END=818 /DNA_ORIENTATION=-
MTSISSSDSLSSWPNRCSAAVLSTGASASATICAVTSRLFTASRRLRAAEPKALTDGAEAVNRIPGADSAPPSPLLQHAVRD